MKHLTTRYIAAATFAVMIALASPAQANPVAVTYSLTGTGTVQSATATTLTLVADANGSFLSGDPALNALWNPVSYSDVSVLDFTTNLLRGTFTLTLANGDTLTGDIFEDQTVPDSSPTQTGPFTQTLTFTGGTGAFAGVNGSLSGLGFLGTNEFTVSGSGTINAAPEPAPWFLFLGGFTLLLAGSYRRFRQSAPRTWVVLGHA